MGGPDRGVSRGADELASGGGARRRSLSPWVVRILGPLLVLAVAVIVGPGFLSSPLRSPEPGASPTPTKGPIQPLRREDRPGPLLPLGWTSRGELRSSQFAAGAMARFRQDRTDVDQLLWAGSLDSVDRVAVVAYRPAPASTAGDGIEVAALRVDVGDETDTADATVISIGSVRGPNGAVGLAWRGADRRTRLVVIGRPEPLAVRVSARADYHRDGSISRRWRDVPSNSGIALTDLGGRVDPVIVVRPVAARSGTAPFLVDVHGIPDVTTRDIKIAGGRDDFYMGPDADQLVAGVAQAVRPIFDLHEADAKVIWDGHIDAGRDSALGADTSGSGALVWVRRKDGPVFQVFVFVNHLGVLRSSAANPVGWAAGDRQPYAFSTFDDGAPLYLLSPSGPGSITVLPSLGQPKVVVLDGNGVGVLMPDANKGPTYRGAGVVVRDRGGRTVLSSQLVDPSIVDAFGLYL